MITNSICRWANRTPRKAALTYNGRVLSYLELARRIAAAHDHFASLGCTGPGYAILIAQDQLEAWILSLGLRSLGLTIFAWPKGFSLDAFVFAETRYVVTGAKEASPGVRNFSARHRLQLLSAPPEYSPESDFDRLDGCPTGGHALLTSGTTGAYKIVMMSAAIDEVLLRLKVQAIGMSSSTVLSVFDYPIWTAAGYRWSASPWTVGGTTLIEGEPERAIIRPDATDAVLIPAVLSRLLDAPTDTFPCNESLRVFVGGGGMTRDQVARAKARISPHLFNWLASTETGGIALTRLETDEDHRWQKPAPDRVIEVVDEFDRRVPPGVTGRIRVATAGGPTSYFCDEKATRKFFKDGYFYRGDLAMTRDDGRLMLQGRTTDVINVAGFKKSSAVIEARLCDALGVTGACILSLQDEIGDQEFHLVLEALAHIDEELLKSELGRERPPLQPLILHYMKALPRNALGKVVRARVEAAIIASELTGSTISF